jgi:hypothetical protein
MSRNIFGWDLPPGVSTRDLPGNGPEDQWAEAFYDEAFTLFDKLNKYENFQGPSDDAHVNYVLEENDLNDVCEHFYKKMGEAYSEGYTARGADEAEAKYLEETEKMASEYFADKPVVVKPSVQDEERDNILASLPKQNSNHEPKRDEPGNAHVYVDQNGRLNILLKDGGWLGVRPEEFKHLLGDIAPFAG